ncbi:cation:proton antiporter [Geobacter sp.]|uniref:cation:proton antiporter domain-containing protein n=1 Tax=Geobacter sp. TaxID=46610 RepID=UPI00261B7BE2|nr:cation:proton antiporter [Geobacter sp.]
MEHSFLIDLEILLGLAVVTVVILRRLRFPSIIGFLATGIMAGPYGLGLIGNARQVEQMAEIGVVLLLFTIGIEFSLKELMRIRHLVFWGGGLQVALTIGIVTLLGVAVGFPSPQAVFFGFLVALSSTAILMKLLMDAGELDAPHGKAALGILIFQDLCVVPLMLFTPFLAGAGDGVRGIVAVALKAAAVVLMAHFGARFAVPWLFTQVVKSRSRELFILAIIFVGFGTAWVTAQVGLSLALGAFIAGLAISGSEYSHQALGDIIPFRDAFMSLFFISVGMLLDPATLIERPLLVGSLVLVILLVKGVVTAGTGLAVGLPARIAVVASLALAQIGEFSFVLCQTGLQHGLLTPAFYQVFLAASVVTMALTPACLAVAPSVAGTLAALVPAPLARGRGALLGEEERVALAGHVVIVGFGVNGRNLSRVLAHQAIPHVVIETNALTVNAERKKGVPIMFGDASRPEVLAHAGIERARIAVVAISDAAATRRIVAQARQMGPTLQIIVRTRYVAEMEPLYKLGANEVIPEEFETSIEIFTRVLRTYLVPYDRIEQCTAEIRRGSYEIFRAMSRRHSHAVGIAGFLSGAEIGTFRVKRGAPIEGESLSRGTLRSRSGATLLVIKRGEEVVPNPDPVWELREGDVVLLLGTPDQLAAAASLFEARRRNPHHPEGAHP